MFAISTRLRGAAAQRAWNVAKKRFSDIPDAKAARRAKIEALKKQSQSTNSGSTAPLLIVTAAVLGSVGYIAYDIQADPKGTFGSRYYGSALDKFLSGFKSRVGDTFLPVSDKLLPDFGDPAVYGQIPPGTPAPPLLVLDLERTLIASVHDPHYGWRHVMRPGLQRFIRDLSQYYELVIFTENDVGAVQEMLMHIDPENRCHKLGSAHAEVRGTQVIKRLDCMNRDMRRIILLDDNPESAKLFPENTLFVRPFVDVNDTNDMVLFDLIPVLEAFVHEGIPDLRQGLNMLGTHQAEEAVVEYQMRLHRKKEEENARRNRGLGGMIRGPQSVAVEDGVRSSILSPKDIVGSIDTAPLEDSNKKTYQVDGTVKEAPKPSQKKKGKFFAALDEMENSKMEAQMRKHELMNKIAMERQLGKSE